MHALAWLPSCPVPGNFGRKVKTVGVHMFTYQFPEGPYLSTQNDSFVADLPVTGTIHIYFFYYDVPGTT